MLKRSELSKKYCNGLGLEIGAFHSPWPVEGQIIHHADSRTRDQLIEWAKTDAAVGEKMIPKIPEINYHTRAEELHSIPFGMYDFIVASHVLEHCFDVIGALKCWLRSIKDGGFILIAVPSRAFCFDKDRPLTTMKNLVNRNVMDESGQDKIRSNIIRESLMMVDKLNDDDALRSTVEHMVEHKEDIHFNVYDFASFQFQMKYMSNEITGLRYCLSECFQHGSELFAVLVKV